MEQLENYRKKLRDMDYSKKLKEEIQERHKVRLLELKKEAVDHNAEEEARKERYAFQMTSKIIFYLSITI